MIWLFQLIYQPKSDDSALKGYDHNNQLIRGNKEQIVSDIWYTLSLTYLSLEPRFFLKHACKSKFKSFHCELQMAIGLSFVNRKICGHNSCMSLHIHSSINKECRGFQYLGWWHGLQWGVRGQLTLHSAVPGYSNHFIHHYFHNWTLWEYHGYLRSIQISGHANFDKFLFGKLGLFGQFGFTYRSNWGTIGFCLQIYNYIGREAQWFTSYSTSDLPPRH